MEKLMQEKVYLKIIFSIFPIFCKQNSFIEFFFPQMGSIILSLNLLKYCLFKKNLEIQDLHVSVIKYHCLCLQSELVLSQREKEPIFILVSKFESFYVIGQWGIVQFLFESGRFINSYTKTWENAPRKCHSDVSKLPKNRKTRIKKKNGKILKPDIEIDIQDLLIFRPCFKFSMRFFPFVMKYLLLIEAITLHSVLKICWIGVKIR